MSPYPHTTPRLARLRRLAGVWLAGVALAATQVAARQGLRVELRIRNRPRHPESGIIAIIPDGGLLPGRQVNFEVRDPDGNRLEAQLLWHNPAQGLGLVFAPPRADTATVLLSPALQPPSRRDSPLRPGLLLYAQNTRPGGASLERALRLPESWPPVPEGIMRPINAISHRYNPLGADDHYLTWYTGWFVLERPETIYFATVSDEGSSLRINGQTVAHWPGLHTRHAGAQGQFGNNIELAAGWHRIEYLHFEVTGPQEQLAVWQRGGRQPGRLPEHIPDQAYAHSGSADVVGMHYADGRRGAWVEGWNQPAGYLWIGDEPINRYRARAEAGSGADALRHRWRLGRDRTLEGAACDWLVRGETHVPLELETAGPGGSVRASATLQMWTPPPACDPDEAATRREYRRVFLGMLNAAAPQVDPCADWHHDYWVTLDRVLDPFQGGELLPTLFARATPSIRRLPMELSQRLETRLSEALRMQPDSRLQLEWLERLEQQARDGDRRFHWRQEQLLALLYDAGDIDAARRLAQRMRQAATGAEQTFLTLVRLGDVERLDGQPERAAEWYERARARQPAAQPSGRLRDLDRLDPRSLGSLRSAPTGMDRTQQWKVRAVQEAAYLSTVTAFLEQDAIDEAFAELRRWERDNPLSKLRGDYPLAAARAYAHVGDHRRALRTLQAYRETVSMTSVLPEAMTLEMECLVRLRRFATARARATELLERFPGHPAGRIAERVLEGVPETAADDDGPLINRPRTP